MDLNSFKQKFIDEAHSLLTNLDNSLIDLEKDPGNRKSIDEVFRVMHTIKGASGMYGFEKLEELTHELESLYDTVRENNLMVSNQLFDITFNAVDHLRALLSDENCEEQENIKHHHALMSGIGSIRINNVTTESQINVSELTKASESNLCSWNILFYPHDEIIRRAINIAYTFHDLFKLGEYKISNQPFQLDSEQYWSIFLVTHRSYEDIEEALLFIIDYCKIVKIANYNIFDNAEFEKRSVKHEVTIENYLVNIGKSEAKTDQEQASEDMPLTKNESATLLNRHITNHIRVSASKLDHLMYLVSELVTAKSELLVSLQKKDDLKAMDAAEQIEKLAKLFSENALSVRLVSLHDMLNRFKRLIRDISKQLNKTVEFVVIGEDTELDKNIIDNIEEPIIHLIRNCIDHGIETPARRRELGKPKAGIIKLEAVTSGNNVFINISDDGNGIDASYIKKKALEKGFISAGMVIPEEEMLKLIFLPGFSTAQNLTNISGRGVGMDIVLKKIQEIRGEITISSNKDIGTCFSLKLQQTISIVDTLLVKSDETTYAIPVQDIETCILEDTKKMIDNQNMLIEYNNALIPYVTISTSRFTGFDQNGSGLAKLVVISRHGKKYALAVNHILGEYQAVVKPLGQTFQNNKMLSGASLLGDGSIALLLDTDKLLSELYKNQIQ